MLRKKHRWDVMAHVLIHALIRVEALVMEDVKEDVVVHVLIVVKTLAKEHAKANAVVDVRVCHNSKLNKFSHEQKIQC